MFNDAKEKSNFIIEDIKLRIQSVLPNGESGHVLHEPEFKGNELKYLKSCIDSGFVSSVGEFVSQFEEKLAAFTGSKYAVVTVNGTSALQLALQVVDVGPESEVILPSLTFVATANAVVYLGARPHFIDVGSARPSIDPLFLEQYLSEIVTLKEGRPFNKKTNLPISAIIPMHAFGHPADMQPIISIGEKFDIPVVEDAAESLGSLLNAKHCGTFGKVSALSFNGNKIITTGGGGAILTDDQEIACKAKHLSTTAKVPHKWKFIHDEIGYNFRMPNINAALGLAQLELLDEKIAKKRKLAEMYISAFKDCEFSKFLQEPPGSISNYWLNTILLNECDPILQEDLIKCLHNAHIFVRPIWEPLHSLAPFKKYFCSNMHNTENLASRVLNLPSSPQLVTYKEL